jgi:hypothetical protein
MYCNSNRNEYVFGTAYLVAQLIASIHTRMRSTDFIIGENHFLSEYKKGEIQLAFVYFNYHIFNSSV